MSSPPSPLTWETFVEYSVGTLPPDVFVRVLAILEPHRCESLFDDFEEDQHSWRTYAHDIWMLIPAEVRAEVDRIVREPFTPCASGTPKPKTALGPYRTPEDKA